MTWHIVYSDGQVILGVFGSALLSKAQECAREVESQTGLAAYVAQVIGKQRPRVGQYVGKYK